MRSAVPPTEMAEMPVIFFTTIGKTAMAPRKIAPTRVSLVKIREICSDVEVPGRTPGIKAPFFCKLVEI